MTVSHEWPALTDLSGTPSHSATIRDVLLPSIKGRLEPQIYAEVANLPAVGDYFNQVAHVGAAAPYAVYVWDGSAWVLSDTGWLTITLGGGFTGAPAPKVRVRNGIVYYMGRVTGSFTANTTTTVGTVPIEARPPASDGRTQTSLATTAGVGGVYADVAATGELKLRLTTTASHTVALGGLSGYAIDPDVA